MHIVITGASRGIGFETALELSKNPQNQILALSRNIDKLHHLQRVAKAYDKNARLDCIAVDLSNPLPDTVLDFLSNWGSLDVLINNAGQLINKPFVSTTLEEWRTVFEQNIFAPVQLIQASLTFLEKSQRAHVLNISSMGGFQGSSKFPGLAAYSSSKAALANLTECLAEELKEKRIAVNCLALGAVQTEMLEAAFPGYQAPVSSQVMGKYIADFALNGYKVFNGKVLPVSVSTP
jgi:short-subunit dehydrogenase